MSSSYCCCTIVINFRSIYTSCSFASVGVPAFFHKPASTTRERRRLVSDQRHSINLILLSSIFYTPNLGKTTSIKQKVILHYDVKTTYPEYWPQFYTATIYKWQRVLSEDKYKDIIIDSLKFMIKDKRVILYAFVIMNNHIHLIWQPMFGYSPSTIQFSFMKYTAQQLKRLLERDNPQVLEGFKVNKHDRHYQIWKREALSIELRTPAVFDQKLEYIHFNPVKSCLCANPEEYHYSSAKFYFDGTDCFNMLTHYSGN